MKKSRVWALIVSVISVLLGVVDASAMIATATVVPGAEGAGKVIQGGELKTDVILDNSPDLIQAALDERVTKIMPSDHPFDVVSRLNGREVSISAMEYEYYSVDTLPVMAQVTTAITGQGVTSAKTSTLVVDNPDYFEVTDTIYVPSVKGFLDNGTADDSRSLVLYVNAKSGANLSVQAVNGGARTAGGKYVPNIPLGTKVYRMARAGSEGVIRNSPFSVLPTKQSNYCQIFNTEVAMSTIAKMSKKEVNWGFSDIEEMNLNKMLREMEGSFKFGVKGRMQNDNDKSWVYFTEGIAYQVSKVIEYDPNNSKNEDLVDITKIIFNGNNGSKKRITIAGSEFVANISKIDSVQKQIDAGNTAVVWGIEWNEIRTNFGTLLLMQDVSMDEYGWSDKAIVIDPNYLCKATFKKLSRNVLDTIKAGTFDGDVVTLQEISCLVLKNAPCHAILTPKAATTPDVPVTGIATSKASDTYTAVGTFDFGATLTVAPATATNDAVTFKSSNTSVATVDADGVVTILANGLAVITATTADGNFTAYHVATVSIA